MNQEPVLIKGVVAFPNPNGNREIRFIDAFYHDLFKIPDHSNIVISYLDGGKRCVPCEYIDDTHVDIDGTAFHICQFAELMMRNGATYEPEHPPADTCRRSHRCPAVRTAAHLLPVGECTSPCFTSFTGRFVFRRFRCRNDYQMSTHIDKCFWAME